MKNLVFTLLLSLSILSLRSQSVTATYNAGDIGSDESAYNAGTTCNGNNTPLVVNIPAGAIVTSVDVSYSMTAQGGGWMSEQRSQIFCQETGNDEGGDITGASAGGTNNPGTINYNRTGLTLSNGTSATGVLTFEMRSYRTWVGTAGCNTTVQKVDNSTWSITVFYDLPIAQTYTSSNVTQNNTSTSPLCTSDQEIIGLEITMNGSLTPLDISQLRLRTDNSTNPLADITNVEVYFTGNSSVFNTASLFGSAAPVATGVDLLINGSQTLLSGTNYFWVAYDINPAATVGNTLDALCNQITIDGTNYAPTVTSPAGSRTISICNPSPGGSTLNPLVWLKASNGTTPSAGTAPLTAWTNQGTYTDPIGVHGTDWGAVNPTFNATGYNFNEKIHFNGDYNYLSLTNDNGVTYGSAYFAIMNDVPTREYQHLLTWYNVSAGPHADGSFHGGGGSGVANFNLLGYNSEFGGTAATDAWRIDGVAIGSEDPINTTHQIVSIVAKNGDFDSYTDRILGGQHGEGTAPANIPERDWSGDVSEIIILDGVGTAAERNQIESYLAIKYGRTLGINGTSKNYSLSNGTTNWNTATNAGFNYDITGISRDDKTTQDQRKSHTEMFTGAIRNDIVTIANGTNFTNPATMSADFSSFVWGHNNAPTINTGAVVSYPTDNGATIRTIFQREWKAQETGTVGTITLEFDMSSVSGVASVAGTNDLANLILLVDEDGDFTNGATAYSPSSFNNTTDIAYFQHDFIGGTGIGNGFYFTLASTNFKATPLPVDLIQYQVYPNSNYEALNDWTVSNEENINYYEIEKSRNGTDWEVLAQLNRIDDMLEEHSYEYIDQNPYNGTSYYRLTEYDNDGGIGYQGIRPFHIKSKVELHAFPNPSKGNLNILIKGDITLVETVFITNSLGQKILNKSNVDKAIMQVQDLPQGFYSIILEKKDGDKIVQKLIIQ